MSVFVFRAEKLTLCKCLGISLGSFGAILMVLLGAEASLGGAMPVDASLGISAKEDGSAAAAAGKPLVGSLFFLVNCTSCALYANIIRAFYAAQANKVDEAQHGELGLGTNSTTTKEPFVAVENGEAGDKHLPLTKSPTSPKEEEWSALYTTLLTLSGAAIFSTIVTLLANTGLWSSLLA